MSEQSSYCEACDRSFPLSHANRHFASKKHKKCKELAREVEMAERGAEADWGVVELTYERLVQSQHDLADAHGALYAVKKADPEGRHRKEEVALRKAKRWVESREHEREIRRDRVRKAERKAEEARQKLYAARRR